jgi:hypothetical protein
MFAILIALAAWIFAFGGSAYFSLVRHQETLMMVRLREEGKTYKKVGEAVGMSPSGARCRILRHQGKL